jgi:hypothetical protein
MSDDAERTTHPSPDSKSLLIDIRKISIVSPSSQTSGSASNSKQASGKEKLTSPYSRHLTPRVRPVFLERACGTCDLCSPCLEDRHERPRSRAMCRDSDASRAPIASRPAANRDRRIWGRVKHQATSDNLRKSEGGNQERTLGRGRDTLFGQRDPSEAVAAPSCRVLR